MPAGHWRAFSTKGIGIDSNLLPFVRGNHPRSSDWVPDPLPGARIWLQNLVCHTFATLGSYPRSGGTSSFSTGNRSIRYVQPGSRRKKSYLACYTSIRPPRQPRSLLSIYVRLSFFNETGRVHRISQIVPAPSEFAMLAVIVVYPIPVDDNPPLDNFLHYPYPQIHNTIIGF